MISGIENFGGFVAGSIVLNMTPGTDTLYIVTRSIAQGPRAGLVSAAGIMTGCVVHVISAALGLSLVLTRFPAIFSLVTWAGALYLAWLGIRTLRSPHPDFETTDSRFSRNTLMTIYRQGVLTNVLNPKVAVFFLAFLPQFITPSAASGPGPFLMLGTTFLVTGTTWSLILTRTAAAMTHRLRTSHRIGMILQKASGLIFLGFGLNLAAGWMIRHV